MHFTGGMSTAMFILYPVFLARLGADELRIGQVMGLGAAAAVVTRPFAGHLLDRLGGRRTLLGAGLLNLACILGLVPQAAIGVPLLTLTVVHAVAVGTLFASYFTYATHIVPAERRIEGVAMFGVAGMLPNGLGPPLSEWLLTAYGSRTYFLIAAGFTTASLLITLLLHDARADHESGPHGAGVVSWLRLVRARTLLLPFVATFLFGVGVAALFTFLAPYAVAVGRGEVGGFFFAYAMAAIFTRIVGGRLPERLGPRRVLVPALLAFAVGLAATPLTSAPASLLAIGALCGMGHGYAFPILNVLAVARTPARVRGAVVSLYTAMIDLGQMVGSPLLGAIAMVSFPAMFATAALALVAAALGMAFLDHPTVLSHDEV
ncbi:MAG: MFS transporter [Deltaproteobacteria bacterium]|nr:MFS transporter [Deltaproteobacteria bacterium]